MLRNYFKTAFRNMRRNKLFTGLNIFGLATGLACSILMAAGRFFSADFPGDDGGYVVNESGGRAATDHDNR